MPRRCCVPGCKSNYTSTKEYVTVFRIVSECKGNSEKLNIWRRNIPREDLIVNDNTAICIKHFTTESIITHDSAVRSDGTVLTVRRTIPKLAKDACPTIFENCPPCRSSKPPPKRRKPDDRLAEQRHQNNDRFPKDETRRKHWVKAVNRMGADGQPWQPSHNSHLCIKHFRPEMINRTGQNVRLRDNAVPTEFDFRPLKGSQKGQKKIQQKILLSATSGAIFADEADLLDESESIYRPKQDTVLSCSAPNCCSDNTESRFFRFPKDENRCTIWVQNCQRRELIGKDPRYLNENCQLCERHFDDSQFVKCYRQNPLKWSAVPTLFASSTVSSARKRPSADSEGTSSKKIKADPCANISSDCDDENETDLWATEHSNQVRVIEPRSEISSQTSSPSIEALVESAKLLGMRAPMVEFFEEQLRKCGRENRQHTMSTSDGSSCSQPVKSDTSEPKARVVIQQCRSAKLLVKPATEATPDLFVQINRGMIVFVCFLQGASSETVQKLAKTVLSIRLSETSEGKHVSILDLPGDVLIVPQATLGGKLKGNAMQYHKNVDKVVGEQLYHEFSDTVQRTFDKNSATIEHGCSILKGTYGNRQVLSVDTNGPYTHLIEI